MTEMVSRPHAANLVRFAKAHPRVVVLSADLTASCEADDFAREIPDRFFNMAMAEQNMLSWAGGMAREGFLPHIHTFAVFLTRRPFDQLAMSVAYPNLPVRLVGFLPGITTPGGVTHQAVDDLALTRVLPNMTVLECGDATDVETALDAAHTVPGPVYVRMLRGVVPRLFAASDPLVVGASRTLSRGRDLLVLSSGICTEEALRAVAVLSARGLAITHIHVSTIKPFADPVLLDALSSVALGVVTLENHSVVGGLGSAVAEAMAERGVGRKLVRLGLQDVYAHGASRPYLAARYGLDAAAVVTAAETLAGQRFGIGPEELASQDVGVRAGSKAEDL
jgi:transketolase